MRKPILFVVAASIVAIAVWRSRPAAPSAADANRLVVDRIWIDHLPRNDTDTVQGFIAISKDARGVFGAASQWRGSHELFRYEARGAELRIVYPQTGERETVRALARRCTEHDMDFCLEIKGASRGVKNYYSRKGWEIDHARGSEAIEARLDALRAQLVAAEPSR
jgi:hypothetical protein